MRASIVVNNFNYARYLRATIDGALAQTHGDVEVIVVDDGSTDASRSIIEGYGDRVKPLLRPNRGQTAALNAAIGLVTGDVVVFLDADDTIAPRAMERAIEHFARDPAVVKVHWRLTDIDRYGEPLGTVTPAASLPDGDLRDVLVAEGPEGCVFPPTSGNAFAAGFVRGEFPLPESPNSIGSASADAYLSVLAALHGRIAACDELLGGYRIHGANGFAGRPVGEQVAHNLTQFEHRCDVLEERCKRLGLHPDADGWRQRSWLYRMKATQATLRSILDERETFILVDQGEWGPDIVSPLVGLPFMERDGHYWGAPADDATAIAEVERLRDAGARHIVIGWPAFWWLEHYGGLQTHLDTRYRPVLQDENLVVYDLEAPACA